MASSEASNSADQPDDALVPELVLEALDREFIDLEESKKLYEKDKKYFRRSRRLAVAIGSVSLLVGLNADEEVVHDSLKIIGFVGALGGAYGAGLATISSVLNKRQFNKKLQD